MTKLIDHNVFRLLRYIYLKGGSVTGFRRIIQELDMNKYILSRALERIEAEGLLKKEIGGFPRKGEYKLTDKGMKIAALVYELLELLGDP